MATKCFNDFWRYYPNAHQKTSIKVQSSTFLFLIWKHTQQKGIHCIRDGSFVVLTAFTSFVATTAYVSTVTTYLLIRRDNIVYLLQNVWQNCNLHIYMAKTVKGIHINLFFCPTSIMKETNFIHLFIFLKHWECSGESMFDLSLKVWAECKIS